MSFSIVQICVVLIVVAATWNECSGIIYPGGQYYSNVYNGIVHPGLAYNNLGLKSYKYLPPIQAPRIPCALRRPYLKSRLLRKYLALKAMKKPFLYGGFPATGCSSCYKNALIHPLGLKCSPLLAAKCHHLHHQFY